MAPSEPTYADIELATRVFGNQLRTFINSLAVNVEDEFHDLQVRVQIMRGIREHAMDAIFATIQRENLYLAPEIAAQFDECLYCGAPLLGRADSANHNGDTEVETDLSSPSSSTSSSSEGDSDNGDDAEEAAQQLVDPADNNLAENGVDGMYS